MCEKTGVEGPYILKKSAFERVFLKEEKSSESCLTQHVRLVLVMLWMSGPQRSGPTPEGRVVQIINSKQSYYQLHKKLFYPTCSLGACSQYIYFQYIFRARTESFLILRL